MTLWRCVACGTKFAVGLRMCPRCTSENAVEDSDDVDVQIELTAEYEGWTKEELQAELEKRDLSRTGNKPELIRRLLDNPSGGNTVSPKISKEQGPSDARQPDAEYGQAVEGAQAWDGTSSSASTEQPPTSDELNSPSDQSPAPTTENPSEMDQTESGTAPSTDGETTAADAAGDRRAEYEGWSKEDLSDELEGRGLPKTGNKPELVDRLVQHDNQTASDAEA